MPNNISYKKLLKWFIREEWRLFTSLFGEKRFILFPFIIFILSIIIGTSAPIAEVSTRYLSIMYFSLIIILGLQTGSIGFDAKDSLNNLLGETSRILYVSKTLPIKRQKLVSLFILKDALFYSVVFLAPITIGSILGLNISPINTTLSNQVPLNLIPMLYLYTILSFIFGVSIGFNITTIRVERISGIIMSSVILSVIYILYINNLINLYIISYVSIHSWMILITFLSIIFISFGLLQFKKTDKINIKPTFKNRYKKMNKYITTDYSATKITVKNLIDIQRSSGGFLKVIFSTATIVLTSFILIRFMSEFFGLAPISTYIYAGLFSLIAYPLYVVSFRYDSFETYSTLPIVNTEVYKAKLLLFTILGIPLSVIFYTPFVMDNVTLISYLKGLTMLIGLIYYQFGILMHLSKDNPMEFLFDGVLFSIYSFSIFVFLIPILVIGMYGLLFAPILATGVFTYTLLAILIGIILIHNKIAL